MTGLAAAAAATGLTPSAAQAALCPFTVTRVNTYAESYVGVEVGQGSSTTVGGWTLCQLNASGSYNLGTRSVVVTPDVCKAMLATLTTALATGREVAFQFESATNCTPGDANGIAPFWGFATPFPSAIQLR